MPRPKFASVDEYLAAQPDRARRVLERVRRIIHKTVPGLEETISYGIPTFKLGDEVVAHIAGWKHFYSFYPANARLAAEFGDELAPYLGAKSTLRFPLSDPVPRRLIERVAAFRAREVRDA
jgi:uncharacterized protein YdhG (YjbR/CyaY superfamily)